MTATANCDKFITNYDSYYKLRQLLQITTEQRVETSLFYENWTPLIYFEVHIFQNNLKGNVYGIRIFLEIQSRSSLQAFCGAALFPKKRPFSLLALV